MPDTSPMVDERSALLQHGRQPISDQQIGSENDDSDLLQNGEPINYSQIGSQESHGDQSLREREFVVYKRRWYILLIFGIMAFVQVCTGLLLPASCIVVTSI